MTHVIGRLQLTDCKFFNNDISGNWYTQVENRDVVSGDVRDFSGNWLGTNARTKTLYLPVAKESPPRSQYRIKT